MLEHQHLMIRAHHTDRWPETHQQHNNPTKLSDVNPNGPIITECKTLRHVVGSTSESETGGFFINGQNIVPKQIKLIELYQIKPKTTLKTYNSNSIDYSTCSICKKRFKSWDIRFHWFCGKYAQEQLNVYGTKASMTMHSISLSITHPPIINACTHDSY